MATFHYRLVSKSGDPCILASDCNRVAQFLGAKKPGIGAGDQYSDRILHPSRLKRLRKQLIDSRLVIDRLSCRADYLRMLRTDYPGLSIKQLEGLGFRIRRFNQSASFKIYK